MIDYTETASNENESILFIHGLGASRWMWWQQEPAFSDYQVILADLPGHGKSVSTPWLSLADTTNLVAQHVIKNRKIHVVGISLGGHVALELAKHYPEKILSTFISGITVQPMHFQFLLKVQSRIVQRGIRNERYLNKLAHGYYHLPPDKSSEFIADYQLLTKETYETIWQEIMQFRLDESYGHIDSPCLIVAGDQESRGILESIEIAPQFIPTAVTRLISDAQHAWPVQKAQQFNRTLREWLVHQSNGMGSRNKNTE
ncbi:alpha/beta fold hydrolase [Planococcus donghaensis]|uniref:alpha/beta fold hydrolase n=1 Tax=Planococcus donghaensis TaxID=414778 RepID=UPI00373580F8